jgi:hypothetical protein
MIQYRVRSGYVAHDISRTRFWREGEVIPPQFLAHILDSQGHKLEEMEDGSKEKESSKERAEEGQEERKEVVASVFVPPEDRMMRMASEKRRGRPKKEVTD